MPGSLIGDLVELLRGLRNMGGVEKFIREERQEPAHPGTQDAPPPATLPPNSAPPPAARSLAKKNAAGTILMDPGGRILFTRRANGRDHGGEWSIPAGMSEDQEFPLETAIRETTEEVGNCGLEPRGMALIDHMLLDGTGFTTFGAKVGDAFTPMLTDEHDAYQWAPIENAPKPLHPGLKATLDFAMDPLTEKGQKILSSMKEQYGPEKGEEVFYASANKGNITGVDNTGASSGNLESGHTYTPFAANLRTADTGPWQTPRFDQPQQNLAAAPQRALATPPPDDISHTWTRKKSHADGTVDQHTAKWSTPRFDQQEQKVSSQPLRPPPSTVQALGPETMHAQKAAQHSTDADMADCGWQSPRFTRDAGTAPRAWDDVKHDPNSGRFTSSGSGASYTKKTQPNGRIDIHHEGTGESIGSVSRPNSAKPQHVAFHKPSSQMVGRPRASQVGASEASRTMSSLMGRAPSINPKSYPSEHAAIKGLIEHHESRGK